MMKLYLYSGPRAALHRLNTEPTIYETLAAEYGWTGDSIG